MPARRPNLLILMPDQMRADCLSVAGHPTVRTPHLDRLAAEGVRFERCYTASPICMPARSTFASGLFCHHHGQWRNYGQLPADTPTYMKTLRAAGYRTAHIGKSHLYEHTPGRHLNEHRPYLQQLGFDDILEATGPHATLHTNSIMTDDWQQKGLLETFREDYRRRGRINSLEATWPSPLPEGETLDDFVGRTAEAYLADYDRPEPFCTFVGFGGPHEPWDPPVSWAERYATAETPAPLPRPTGTADLPPAARAYEAEICNRELTPAQAQAIQRLYYAKIAHIDDWIGRILATLKRTGRLADTFILFWSDHGERLADRGGLFKQVFYDESARVPLILRRPDGVGAGQVAQTLCGTADLPATLCAAGGVAPVGWGRSLLPATENAAASVHDAVFSQVDHAHCRATMIRTETHKLVIESSGQPLQMFDLANDPQELVNLAGRADQAAPEAALRARLLQWRLQTEFDQQGSPQAQKK